MFIDPIPAEGAPDEVAAIYEGSEGAWGFVPNYAGAFSHHPEAFAAWSQLIRSIKLNMDPRRCELATLAAARTMKTTYCSLAHARLLQEWFDDDSMERMVEDHHDADLDAVDVAVIDFATKVATEPTSITQQDVDALKSLGLDDRDVTDIVLAVGARAFFSTVIESLGAQADVEMTQTLPAAAVDRLIVGRPVENT